jgi:hypothetical protein
MPCKPFAGISQGVAVRNDRDIGVRLGWIKDGHDLCRECHKQRPVTLQFWLEKIDLVRPGWTDRRKQTEAFKEPVDLWLAGEEAPWLFIDSIWKSKADACANVGRERNGCSNSADCSDVQIASSHRMRSSCPICMAQYHWEAET